MMNDEVPIVPGGQGEIVWSRPEVVGYNTVWEYVKRAVDVAL